MKKLFLSISVTLALWIIIPPGLLKAAGSGIKPYGNLYMFYGYRQSATYDAAEEKSTDNDTLYKINNNSNLGFNFRYSKYSGVFELGIDDYENNRDVKIRKAFGVYKLSIGELMIGQNWSPYVKWSHEASNYYRSEGFGALYEDFTTQIKFTSNIGIYLDIMRPYVPTETFYSEQKYNPDPANPSYIEYKYTRVDREITTGLPLDNIKSIVPKIALGYELNMGQFNLGLGAAGNMYSIDKNDDISFNKEWIISYLAYLHLDYRISFFLINLSAGYAVNPANFGIVVQSSGNNTYYPGAAAKIKNLATGQWELKDTWNVQGYGELGFEISNSVRIFLGYGFSLTDYPVENTEKDYAMEYYINAKFNLGGLIALTPALSYRDYMKDMAGKKEGSDLYAGILATVSFY